MVTSDRQTGLGGGQGPEGTCLAVTHVRQVHLTDILWEMWPTNFVDGCR